MELYCNRNVYKTSRFGQMLRLQTILMVTIPLQTLRKSVQVAVVVGTGEGVVLFLGLPYSAL